LIEALATVFSFAVSSIVVMPRSADYGTTICKTPVSYRRLNSSINQPLYPWRNHWQSVQTASTLSVRRILFGFLFIRRGDKLGELQL